MRRLVVPTLLVLACREPAHITVDLQMMCRDIMVADSTGNVPPPPANCSSMQLDCANFLELRLYESRNGAPGNILSSRCLPLDQIQPRPKTMCDLMDLKGTVSLLDDLPEGKDVLFRMRGLYVYDPTNQCNDDIPGIPTPVLLFDGFSGVVPIDGNSHQAAIDVTTCGNCKNLPPASMCTPNQTCPPLDCPPGTTPTIFPGDPSCCPHDCLGCDPSTDPNCTMMQTCSSPCPQNPGICADGSMPVKFPGACCPVCPNQPPPPMVTPDGGVVSH